MIVKMVEVIEMVEMIEVVSDNLNEVKKLIDCEEIWWNEINKRVWKQSLRYEKRSFDENDVYGNCWERV